MKIIDVNTYTQCDLSFDDSERTSFTRGRRIGAALLANVRSPRSRYITTTTVSRLRAGYLVGKASRRI